MAFSALTRAQFQDLFDVYVGTATVDPASVAAAAEGTANVTVTGAALGDIVLAGPGVDLDALQVSVQVVSANTVQINYANMTGDHIDIASSTWNFVILRPKAKITSL